MMKLKITLLLFTCFLLGAAAPKALLKLGSGHPSISLEIPHVSFHHPVFVEKKKEQNEVKSSKTIARDLTKAYQQALYSQWEQEEVVSAPVVEARPVNKAVPKKRPTPKKYTSAPKYNYRKVQDADNGEINDRELIEHFGFDVEHPKVASWSAAYDSQKIASTLNQLKSNETKRVVAQADKNQQEQQTDEVEFKQASILESAQKEAQENNEYSAKEMDDETWEEELVMIDYSDEKPEEEQGVENRDRPQYKNELSEAEAMQLLAQGGPTSGEEESLPVKQNENEAEVLSMSDDLTSAQDIPASVMSAISREMDKRDDIPTVATVNTQKAEYSPPKPKASRPVKSGLSTHEKETPYSNKRVSRSLNKVSIHEALINRKNSGQEELRNFEFFSETLYSETYTDNEEGKVELDFDMSSDMGVLRGTVLKHGYMRTKVDLVLEPGAYDVQIPMIEQDTFGRFLDDEGIYGRGGYVLVRLPRSADTVEIDAGYEAKIYLDENFMDVDQNDYFEFVLFAGVEPGNILISYQNSNEKVADKISHVVEDEVLFEAGIIVESEELFFKLEEKNMLSRRNSSVDIHPDQINYFNRRVQASQEAVSSYSIQTPLRALGMRDYLELRHTRLPMFAGLWSNNKLELPSENFANYILDSHQISSLENACMVQINLTRPLRDARFFGETKRGPMGIVQSYLDEDGEFNYDPSEMATHIFLIGDLQGTISGKLEYADGSYDFVQTFCSNNTYLIEQL